ncbi:hypothetical protein DRJ25_00040 [Candidatus Woesearchaeota archaeon]|nr:MAG: hypothetical protein DRJ25_00040 [Candidatus Woesearchaeota archaeon]
MKRKAIQLAEKTMVVSLPQEWVKEWEIQKGDELNIEPKGSSLIISTQNKRKKLTTTINITNSTERVIRWWLSSLHKKGYDEIEIFYKKEQLPLLMELTRDLMLGFTIVEQTEKRCILRAISQADEQSFNNVMRRAFQVTLTMGDSLVEALSKKELDETELNQIKQMEKTNNQLTNFCQRVINKRGLSDPVKNSFYYTINWNLEKIADEYKYIIEHIIKEKIKTSKETIELIKEANELLRGFYEFFYEKKQEKINKLQIKKKELKEKIKESVKKEGKESLILSQLLCLTDKISDFSASMIAIHTET